MHEIKNILAGLPFPALAIGSRSQVAACNDAALALFGNDLEGRGFITIIRQPDVLAAIEKAERGQKAEAAYFSRQGDVESIFNVICYEAVVQSASYIICLFQDRSEGDAVDKMRRDFIANLSHELRSPLTAISGFIETLRGPAKNDPKAQERFLGMMEDEAGRMRRLVADLLVLSRVEANERIRPRELGDLRAIVRDTCEILQEIAERNSVEVVLNLPENAIDVPHDPDQMRQVFTNLIENAIKYGGSGGRVEVSISEPAYQTALGTVGVKCEIRDWGGGIAEEHIPRLTERFYRVDGHRSRQIGGTGLGLAIVKHIILRHRGKLRVHSALGEGSIFSFYLPSETS